MLKAEQSGQPAPEDVFMGPDASVDSLHAIVEPWLNSNIGLVRAEPSLATYGPNK